MVFGKAHDGVFLVEGVGDEGGNDTPAVLAGMGQDIAHEVHPATLPGGVQDFGNRRLEPLMRIRDHQLDAAQAAPGQRAQKLDPEGLSLGGTLLHGSVVRRRGLDGISGPRFSPWAAPVPFKANQDRRHHFPKQRHRVTNWAAYDIALRQRGSLTVWFTETAIAAWKAEPRYSALAITTALTLRAVFRLALRQTEGLVASMLRLLGLDLAAPDHSTMSRRGETLPVSRPRPGSEPVHLLVDSTGLKL